MFKSAIILAGAGNKDGSEIHETVSALLAIDSLGGRYQCFAPDIDYDEFDYLTNQPTGKTRNVMQESAKIARGNIQPLSQLNVDGFDMLVLPGGLGAIKNLSNYAEKGVDFTVNKDLITAVNSFHEENKPIVALCIAPVLIAKIIKGAKVTIGDDKNLAKEIVSMGSEMKSVHNATDIIVDEQNKIITNPCYMLADTISQVANGAFNAISKAKELI